MLGRVLFPHSLGIFYTALTQWLGFPHYGDEGKVMGLAPYGDPERHLAAMRKIARSENGSFRLGLEYFTHHTRGVEMTWGDGSPTVGRIFSSRLEEELGPARSPAEELATRHIDVAAALQARLEELVLELAESLAATTASPNLCLAGGVALNAVANGRIRPETRFEELYVQPAAGDSGTAVGAALDVWCSTLGRPRGPAMRHAYTGPRMATAQSSRPWPRRESRASGSTTTRSSGSSPSGSRRVTSSAGSRAAWSSGRAPSGTARSSPTRAASR